LSVDLRIGLNPMAAQCSTESHLVVFCQSIHAALWLRAAGP